MDEAEKMILKNGLKQQSLAKHQVCALLLGLLMAGVLLAMTVMPSNAREASPPSSWGKTYGGTGNEEAFGVQQTFDGGFIVGGTASVSGLDVGDLGDFWIVKLDSEGAVEWEKTFGGDGEDYLLTIQQTSDGGYIAGGGTDSFGAGSTDFWVLKLDNDGNIQWQNAYGESGEDAGAFAIQQTRDGGYIVGGFTRSFGTMGDLLVLKLDPLGNIEWQKTYGGTGIERRVQAIVQTSDEGYILGSSTTSFIPPDVP